MPSTIREIHRLHGTVEQVVQHCRHRLGLRQQLRVLRSISRAHLVSIARAAARFTTAPVPSAARLYSDILTAAIQEANFLMGFGEDDALHKVQLQAKSQPLLDYVRC